MAEKTRTIPLRGLGQRLMMDTQRQRLLAAVILITGIGAALALHLAAGYHLPTAWDDESHFMIPARNMARGLGLVAPQLNAPQGIFWMPDGYYLLLGLVFSVLSPSLEVARWISFGLVAATAGTFYLISRRLNIAPAVGAALAAIWLVTPRVVILGNMARMESAVIALLALALLLAVNQRWLLALISAALLPLFHPIGIPLFLIFPAAALIFHQSIRPRHRLEWLLIFAIGVIWAAEIARFIAFADVAQAQLAFQLERKGQSLIPLTILHLVLLLANLHGALIGWMMAGRRHGTQHRGQLAGLVLMFLVAGALALVYPLGREDWYEVYTTELALVLTLFAHIGLLIRLTADAAPRTWGLPPLRVMPVVMIFSALIVVLPHAIQSLAQPEPPYVFRGMALTASSRAVWFDFLAQAEAELTRLDGSLTEPALVQVDRLANLDMLVTDNPWRNLRLIQITPVTPLDESAPVSFMLFTSYPPAWKQAQIADRFPDAPQLLQVTSDDGVFEMILFDLRQDTSDDSTEPPA